jgi:hypothetical protein
VIPIQGKILYQCEIQAEDGTRKIVIYRTALDKSEIKNPHFIQRSYQLISDSRYNMDQKQKMETEEIIDTVYTKLPPFQREEIQCKQIKPRKGEE